MEVLAGTIFSLSLYLAKADTHHCFLPVDRYHLSGAIFVLFLCLTKANGHHYFSFIPFFFLFPWQVPSSCSSSAMLTVPVSSRKEILHIWCLCFCSCSPRDAPWSPGFGGQGESCVHGSHETITIRKIVLIGRLSPPGTAQIADWNIPHLSEKEAYLSRSFGLRGRLLVSHTSR